MKFSTSILVLLSLTATVHTAALPNPATSTSLSLRTTLPDLVPLPQLPHLTKRKGGGGGTKGGSGSSSSGSSSSSSSHLTSSSSNSGGRTGAGSGVAPSYGAGGRYYAGGSSTPYTSGSRSPLGVAPVLFAAPALAFGGVWAYGAYGYPYTHPYAFHNASAVNGTGANQTVPVECLCARYAECGCDDNGDDSYLSGVVGNGSQSDMDPTVARVANVNGTNTLLVNGTLDNGTTAAGGSDSAAVGMGMLLREAGGWWVLGAGVVYTVLFV